MTTLSDSYNNFQKQLCNFCRQHKIERENITLIAVSKKSTLKEVDTLISLGQRDFAESRIPDCLEKVSARPDCIWHFIGPLQSNKVKKVVQHFSWIHSVDSVALAKNIAKEARRQGKKIRVCIQVNYSFEKNKQGFSPQNFLDSLPVLAQIKEIEIVGLMTMAPLTRDTEQIRACFSSCQSLLPNLQQFFPNASHLSMGMSQDFTISLEEGSTMIRIGSAIFSGKK